MTGCSRVAYFGKMHNLKFACGLILLSTSAYSSLPAEASTYQNGKWKINRMASFKAAEMFLQFSNTLPGSAGSLGLSQENPVDPAYHDQFKEEFLKFCDVPFSELGLVLKSIQEELLTIADEIILNVNQYEKKMEQIQDNINALDLTIKEFSMDASDDLQSSYNCYLQAVQSRLDKIKNLKRKHDNEKLLRVKALLSPENYGKAEVLFHEINDGSHIIPVAQGLYGTDDYDMPLVGFTSILHSQQQRLVLYKEWVNQLEENSELLSNKIFVFLKVIEEEVKKAGGSIPTELQELHDRIKIYSEAVTNLWAREIRKGNFIEIINFGSPNRMHIIGSIFSELLPDLIRTSYDDRTVNFKLVLEFIKNLHWNVHKYIGLNTLFFLIDELDDRRMVVALEIREALDGCSLKGPDSLLEVIEMFKELKARLPGNIRALLWHNLCYLKNEENGEYLSGDATRFDSENRKVFTLVGGAKSSTSTFKLETKSTLEGDSLLFQIQNLYWPDKYLDVHTKNSDANPNSKHISLRNMDPGYNWKVEILTNFEVKIYHVEVNGYLMSSFMPPSGPFREVYIWVSDIEPPTSIWTLECQ